MDKKFCYCVFYTFLLMTITPAMCRRRAKSGQSERSSERRRYAAALLPALPSLAGTAVVPWLFLALVAVYGAAALARYAITENTFFRFQVISNEQSMGCKNNCTIKKIFAACCHAYMTLTCPTAEDRCYPQNTCANNRGHCRDPNCWSNEFPLWTLADVCGGACPCCVVDYVYEEITGRKPPLGK